MKRKSILFPVIFALVIPMLAVLQGCPRFDPEDPDDAKRYLRTQCMDVFYYWRDDVIDRNAKIDPSPYDIYDYFDALLYKQDRWSWMCDKDYYVSEETGVLSGTWGVSLGQAVEYYNDYNLRVRFVYPGSPFERFGVTRGAVLTRINGQSVEDDETGFTNEKLKIYQEQYFQSPQTFTFRLTDGRDTTFTASMSQSLSTRSSLVTRIFQPDEFEGLTVPVGYFHYMAFKNNFLDDIARAMDSFRGAGVRNLIVDLRYNGGGDARASDTLMTYLAPRSAVGKPYVIRRHNSYLASLDDEFKDENNTYYIGSNAAGLDLDRIYFIVGPGTASASEMVINGLKPYMGEKMQMVGDTTYGKPNGMYVLMYPGTNADYKDYNNNIFTKLQWVFMPIAFFNENARGESIPWTGFVPDRYCPDDLYHDFGVEENDIRSCLTHIVTGTWPAIAPVPVPTTKAKAEYKSGYRIDTEEDSRGYGRYVVKNDVFWK